MPALELVRALPVEDMDLTGRTLEGQALAWDRLYRVTDNGRVFYEEGFRRGSFTESLSARSWFELRPEHVDDRIGAVRFHESRDGLVFVANVEPGERGDTELDLVRAGQRDGVSIRYAPSRNEPHAPPWWRLRVDLREMSLTARPQYGPDARVMAMRSHRWQRPADVTALLDWTPPAV